MPRPYLRPRPGRALQWPGPRAGCRWGVRCRGAESGLGDFRQGPGQQAGPAYLLGRYLGRAGNRLDHHSFQGTLVQLTGKQTDEELAFRHRGALEHRCQQAFALRLGARAADLADRLEYRVGLGDGQRGDGRRGKARAGTGRAGTRRDASSCSGG